MAIKDTSKKPYIIDNDSNIKVGIDLPFRAEGGFAATSTTIEAVKNNIRNLLQTNPGERLMQPNLGVELRSLLFEQIDESTLLSIQDTILDSLEFWLPFVEINNIEIETDEANANALIVSVTFNITKVPNALDSVTVRIE